MISAIRVSKPRRTVSIAALAPFSGLSFAFASCDSMRSIAFSAASSDGRPPSESLRSISSSRAVIVASASPSTAVVCSCRSAALREAAERRSSARSIQLATEPRAAAVLAACSRLRRSVASAARARRPSSSSAAMPAGLRARSATAWSFATAASSSSDCSGRLRFWALRVCAAPASAALLALTAASHSSSDMPAWRAAWRAAFRASASRLSSPREGLRFGAALMGAPAAQVGGFVSARLAPMAGFRRGRRMKRLRVA